MSDLAKKVDLTSPPPKLWNMFAEERAQHRPQIVDVPVLVDTRRANPQERVRKRTGTRTVDVRVQVDENLCEAVDDVPGPEVAEQFVDARVPQAQVGVEIQP